MEAAERVPPTHRELAGSYAASATDDFAKGCVEADLANARDQANDRFHATPQERRERLEASASHFERATVGGLLAIAFALLARDE